MPKDIRSRQSVIAYGEEPEFQFNLYTFNRIATWLKDTSPKLIDPRSSGRKLRFLEYSRFGLHENLEKFGVQMDYGNRIDRICHSGSVQVWRYKAKVGKPVRLPKAKGGTDDIPDYGSHTYRWVDAEGEEKECSVELSLLKKLVPVVAAFQQRLRETKRSRLLFDELLYNLQSQAAILRLHDLDHEIQLLDAQRADNPDDGEWNARWELRTGEREQLTRESAYYLANP